MAYEVLKWDQTFVDEDESSSLPRLVEQLNDAVDNGAEFVHLVNEQTIIIHVPDNV